MKTEKGISYLNRTSVYLDGKLIGEIREEIDGSGFRYYPKGSVSGGDAFKTVGACKASLEAQ